MLLPCLNEYETEAGCDEAGRGCIAGPVAAAAVILPAGFSHPLLNDSKQLTHRQRCLMRTVIEKEAAGWAVAMVDSVEIDQINILKASIKAMHLAIDRLTTVPTFLLIDGNRFIKYKKIRHRCIVKGDAIYSSIAAASILAKTHRDEWMDKAHEIYPHYGWNSNRGYPTAIHRKAIEQYGLTPLHRKSFKLTNTQMSINF